MCVHERHSSWKVSFFWVGMLYRFPFSVCMSVCRYGHHVRGRNQVYRNRGFPPIVCCVVCCDPRNLSAFLVCSFFSYKILQKLTRSPPPSFISHFFFLFLQKKSEERKRFDPPPFSSPETSINTLRHQYVPRVIVFTMSYDMCRRAPNHTKPHPLLRQRKWTNGSDTTAMGRCVANSIYRTHRGSACVSVSRGGGGHRGSRLHHARVSSRTGSTKTSCGGAQRAHGGTAPHHGPL